MNRSALERAVARATGESRRTIRRYGFSLASDDFPSTMAPAHLGLDCPGCGAGLPLHHTRPELPEFAECPNCDAVYPYEPEEVYLAETVDEVTAACA